MDVIEVGQYWEMYRRQYHDKCFTWVLSCREFLITIKFKIAATASASSAGYSQGNRVSPGVVVGTYSSSDHGDGIFPDLNRVGIIILSSFS